MGGSIGRLLAVAMVPLILAACSGGSLEARSLPSSAPSHRSSRTLPWGCGGTAVLRADAPAWARTGGRLELPWARGGPADAIAYVWGGQLVAGGRRPDGSADKVLWVTEQTPGDLQISGRPYGGTSPAVPVEGQITNVNQMPSIVSVPTPGCWSFTVSWGLWGQPRRKSVINLEVLPAAPS